MSKNRPLTSSVPYPPPSIIPEPKLEDLECMFLICSCVSDYLKGFNTLGESKVQLLGKKPNVEHNFLCTFTCECTNILKHHHASSPGFFQLLSISKTQLFYLLYRIQLIRTDIHDGMATSSSPPPNNQWSTSQRLLCPQNSLPVLSSTYGSTVAWIHFASITLHCKKAVQQNF